MFFLFLEEETTRKSNPWKGDKCDCPRGFHFRGEHGGDCWREGVCYTLWFGECGEEVAAYKGEMGRTSYTRVLEHLDRHTPALKGGIRVTKHIQNFVFGNLLVLAR